MRWLLLTVASWTAWAVGDVAFADSTRPYDLHLAVEATDTDVAPEALRADLEAVLADEIARRRCYRSLSVAGDDNADASEGPVRLVVTVEDYESETLHDLSLAAHHMAEQPDQRLLFDVRILLRTRVHLSAAGNTLVDKPYRVRHEHRPRVTGEDAEAVVRARLLDDFATRVASMACKPSERKIAAALATD